MVASICSTCSTSLSRNDFTCPVCGKGYCKLHVINSEKDRCQKCGTVHTRDTALKFNGTCPIIPQSTCPKCAGTLRLDKLPAGQHFLLCAKCGWNSFEAQPMICYQAENIVLKEASKLGIVRTPKACEGKLKKSQGEDFCPNCLINKLKSSNTLDFSTVASFVKMDEADALPLLSMLAKDYNLTGIIDEPTKHFTYVDPTFKDRVNDQVKSAGYIAVEALAKNLGINLDQALKLMYEIIRNERLRGTFSIQKKFYYAATFLQSKLVQLANESGEINIDEFATKHDVHPDIIKDNLASLLKTRDIDGYFAAKGTKVYTKTKLMDLVFDYADKHNKFKLESVASDLDITDELARSMLHELAKLGRLRGVFTQKREYMTDMALKDEIGQIVMTYRRITLEELSRRLGITEKTVEESLASLIARGDIAGYIDLHTREFKLEEAQPAAKPAKQGKSAKPAAKQEPVADQARDEKYIEVVREYDFIGGQVHFKIAVRNNSTAAIYDVKVVIDYPDAFQTDDEMIAVPVIEPNSSRGVDFYLEPTTCGKSQVGGTVIYKDYTATPHTINVDAKEVWIKCPLVVSTMDTLDDVMIVTQSLPSDARSFLISDIDARLAYHAGFRAISHFDARCVAAPEKMEGDMFEAEAYFATKVKVGGGGRIVIKLSVSEKTQVLEVRAWCADAGQLTGLLAKIIEYLFQEINTIRKIKADSREKTIDMMAIAQGMTVLSDYVMLSWKSGDICNKLEDIYARLTRLLKTDNLLVEMKEWLDRLRTQNEEENISKDIVDELSPAIERWQDEIKRKTNLTE